MDRKIFVRHRWCVSGFENKRLEESSESLQYKILAYITATLERPKVFGSLNRGDKIYLYDFSDGCKMTEAEVESVTKLDKTSDVTVWYKKENDNEDASVLAMSGTIHYSNNKAVFVLSTNKNLFNLFKNIFDAGIEYCQHQLKNVLGID